jgi:hypothetical protein
MPRKKARHIVRAQSQPHEPRNESGASTVAGPSRAPAPARRRPQHNEDEDDDDEDEDAMDEDVPARKRRAPDRHVPKGTPIASGFAKRKKRAPRRPDDPPIPSVADDATAVRTHASSPTFGPTAATSSRPVGPVATHSPRIGSKTDARPRSDVKPSSELCCESSVRLASLATG